MIASKIKTVEFRERILLIDEKWDTSLFIALQQEGFEVTACESPQKAWGLVYPSRPDFVIVHLPHPSGKDKAILQECRVLADGVPIIVAAPVAGQEALVKELNGAAPLFLPLPLKPNTVRDVLESPTTDRRTGSGWGRRP